MDEETIRLIAYRIWEDQGKPDGQDFVHWLQARNELGATTTEEFSGSPESSVARSKPERSKRKPPSSATTEKVRRK